MTTTKTVFTITTLAFAAMFGGGVYLFTQLNSIVKPLTEKIATQALGVPVSIGGMNISLQEKRVIVNNIRIANPKGFSKPHVLTISGVDVGLRDLIKDRIDFNNIAVTGAQVYLEVKEGGTNLQALKNNMPKPTAKDTSEPAEPIKVIVRKFTLKDGQLNPSVTLIGEQDLAPVKLSSLVLSDIGVKENGILAREAITQIITPLIKSVSKDAGSAGFFEGLSADALKDMGMEQIEGLKGTINDEVNKIGDRFKGMFQ